MTDQRPSRHCLQRLRQRFARLSPGEQVVAGYVLQNPEEAVSSSVHEIAEVCGTSSSMVVRLAKDIGFSGIKEMKLALAQEIGTLLPRIEAHESSAEGHVRELLDNTLLGLQETAAQVDLPTVRRAADILARARHVDVYGAGSSYLVGADLVEKLKRLGIYASTYDNSYMQAISSGGLGAEDAAVGITYSGETQNVLDALGMAREQGASTIAITNFPDSSVVQVAELIIPTSVTRHLLPDGSLGGQMAQLFVIDLLFIELFASDPARFREAFRKYNRILLNKVSKVRPGAEAGEAGTAATEADGTGGGPRTVDDAGTMDRILDLVGSEE